MNKRIVLIFSGLVLLWSVLASCSVSRRQQTARLERQIKQSPVFSKAFTGFTLLDPSSGKILANVNGDHYFTPASNTKILTLAVCLEVLGDSLPALRYTVRDSAVHLIGVGDPTFLHPNFKHWRHSYDFFTGVNMPIYLDYTRRTEPRFGPGWAWDDYSTDYQQEKTILPIYGNTVKLTGLPDSRLLVEPAFFRTVVEYPCHRGDTWFPDDIARRETDNMICMKRPIRPGESVLVPFITPYLPGLIGDTIHRQDIDVAGEWQPVHADEWETVFSTPTDTALRRMMYESDNFFAEQLLLSAAMERFNVFQQDTIIKWALDSLFSTLPQRPRWVDGSGLSRYNLISPYDLVVILQQLWQKLPESALLRYFPAGGANGTLKDWYAGQDGKPFVFAKTGSMSGVHCLSGFVRCKSGKLVIFSFMHNNFVGSNKAWKMEMQRLLEYIAARC